MEAYREKSFWLSQMELTPNPPLEGDLHCDVAIIGGGFTGMATAYFLKVLDPAIRVAVLEDQVVGYGASGRNAGFSMRLFGLTLPVTAARFGKERALEAHRYMTEAVSLVRELVEEHNIDCDYEHTGFLRLATSPAYEKRIRKELAFARRIGLDDMQWLDARQVEEEVRSPLFGGGAWDPHSAILNPAKLVRGMKAVVENMGVQVHEGTPVQKVHTDQGVRLDTPGGSVHAERVVVATNAYTHLLGLAPLKQMPGFTHIILTEPLDDRRLAEIGWQNRQGLEDARNLIHYFRLTRDNRLLLGGNDIVLPFGRQMALDQAPEVFAGLEQSMARLFPPLAGTKITHRWGGPVSITLDMAPAIGELRGGRILYSLGCMGHGVSLTHLNGKTLAELILGQQTSRTETFFVKRRVPPWPPEPLRYALGQTARSVLRLQDRFTDA